jgi:hypothetical protein
MFNNVKECNFLQVKNLEIQVQVFSSLLQTQSSIIAKYINLGQSVAGTKCCDIRIKLEHQANQIRELERKQATSVTLISNTQRIIRLLADDVMKLTGELYIFSPLES